MSSVAARLVALVVVLTFGVGHPAVCAGWAATPEGRMDCCTDSSCLMHESEEPGRPRVISQSEADGCCAASEQDDSAPSAGGAGFLVTLEALHGPAGFDLSRVCPSPEWWRTEAPGPIAHTPKHVLLSVFLV